MKNIFVTVIKKGGYDLTATLRKIDEYHIEGKLTDAERAELYEMARGGAAPQYDVAREIERLWAAIRELQAASEPDEPVNPDEPGEPTEPEEEDVADFVQPTGAHDAYQNGDKVKFNGKVWESIIDNNVWSPADYPAGWREVTE